MDPNQSQRPNGVPPPTSRRLHIAHRRSPSEMTPLVSVLTSPGVDQLAIQQQIELLQQQQQQLQATQQQFVMLQQGALPMTQMGHQMGAAGAFQFPIQVPQNMGLAPPQQQQQHGNSHRRTPSAVQNMNLGGPPPAPSSGASNSIGGDNNGHTGGHSGRGGRGGHQRRHSLALADARKAAEAAQQKRTTSGFQFPAAPAGGSSTNDETMSNASSEATHQSYNSNRPARGGHGRSQSMAIGSRGGAAGGRTPSEGGRSGHGRTPSRNFEGNWRQNQGQPQNNSSSNNNNNQDSNAQQQQPQQAGNPQGAYQPGHRSRASVNQSISSIGSFQYPPQPMMAMGNQMLLPGMNMGGMGLNAVQLGQLQALQAQAQVQGQMVNPLMGLQASQHAPMMQQGQQQNQGNSVQRKTLFTPYLAQATLPVLTSNGQLVAGILRVNKKNRSDAYVTTQDGLLDADIFICGSKDRNRALEGDLVAVELLDVDEVWSQKREKEEKKKRKDHTESRNGNRDDGPSEGGIRRRGSLRERPTQKKNDDVEVEGQSLLLVEEEEITDEQKPLYAGHVVAVIDRTSGQMFSGTLGLLRPSSQATKDKQEAERAARDGGNSRPHAVERPKIVWFKPTDKRVPLIAIPTEQAPQDFVENHQAYADRIFVASIKRWPITSLHPFGTLVEQLGKMGDVKVETDALLRDNNFASDEFSDAVIRSVGLTNWSLEAEPAEEIALRRDFRDEKVFTVDFGGTMELGNAIHVKTRDDGKLEIGFHVPDVTHFVKPGSLADREARKRGTAVHLLNRACPLLPHKLWADVCALKPNEDRLSFSVVFTVNPVTGVIEENETWAGKAIMKSTSTIDLNVLDGILAGKDEYSGPIPPWDIRTLNAVVEKFKEKRLGGGSDPIAPLRLLSQLDDENMPVRTNLFEVSGATELLEELTHTVNIWVAQKILGSHPEKALLRRHMPPSPRRLQTFVDRMTALGFDIDASSSGKLQNSLFKVDDDDVRKGMETLLFKTMQRAKYFVAGKTSQELWPHYALNVPVYTHFTRPTHRFADIIVHRQLYAALNPEEGKAPVYNEDIDALSKTVDLYNVKEESAQNAQEQSVHIESCRAMDKERLAIDGDMVVEGIVVCVYESAFDVLIPQWGFEKRVHCDQLPLKKAEFRKDKRVLELYWEKGVPSSAYVPEDERPKNNMSQRVSNAAAAARQAEEAERVKKEREEATRKQTETGTMSTDDVDALFDDEEDDNNSELADSMAGVSLTAGRPTQSVPGSPSRQTGNSANLHRTRSDSKVASGEGSQQSLKDKYLKFFKLREEDGEFIQDVTEMTRIPVILKTDLSKSPPCLTIRSLNPYAL
ncbi:Protein SSD1 [Ceratocystis lukuohia]|uniref:Protein SSD1 n=2 Tax=Ceratocystis TaxID=5157 RepID=A0A0F8BTB5_CERFI|nr:Protein SSD1 [Ceratocystis platani]